MKDYIFNEYDLEAVKRIDDFLPDKIFDMHMHVSHISNKEHNKLGFAEYNKDMQILLGKERLNAMELFFRIKNF